jgi:hypothetical protein
VHHFDKRLVLTVTIGFIDIKNGALKAPAVSATRRLASAAGVRVYSARMNDREMSFCGFAAPGITRGWLL